MKVGDLVKWSASERAYHVASSDFPCGKNLTEHRRHGIIVDKNPVYFFVLWETGETFAQSPETLEVISESR